MVLTDIFIVNFYWIDFAIGISICLIVTILSKISKIEKFTWYLYWIGFSLGMCWEFSMIFCTELGIFTFHIYHTPPPTHFMVIVIIHSLWDGGLFLVGYGFVKKICAKPHFDRFKIKELGILLIWGQIQELAVELTSTYSNAWEYVVYWWNPVLFVFNGQNITLCPQIIWFIAPIAFYYIALKLKPRFYEENKDINQK